MGYLRCYVMCKSDLNYIVRKSETLCRYRIYKHYRNMHNGFKEDETS